MEYGIIWLSVLYECCHSPFHTPSTDAGSDIVIDDTMVEVAAGAGATFMAQFFGNEEEVSGAAEILESGTLLFILEAARKFLLDFVAWLARIISVLLYDE